MITGPEPLKHYILALAWINRQEHVGSECDGPRCQIDTDIIAAPK
jgi:hypothetical protein